MANEAILIFETEPPIPFTCSNTTGIEKGAILKMSDLMTAAASNGAADFVAGVAAEEKIALDGKTKIAVYRRGIFKMFLSGACVVADPLVTDAAPNYVDYSPTYLLSGSRILGTALETGADTESILVELNPDYGVAVSA